MDNQLEQTEAKIGDNLEKNYQKKNNFFYESIEKKISENLEYLTPMFAKIRTNVLNKQQLDISEFEMLGIFSYMVGIELTNNPYIMEKPANTVAARFAKNLIDDKLMVNEFIEAVKDIKDTDFIDTKESMKNSVLQTIKKFDEKEMKDVRGIVKTIFANSIIPVNYAVQKNDLVTKQFLSYEDILKINTLINQHIQFNGSKAIKGYINLYSNKLFNELLHTASMKFDDQKFAVIYTDSIFSVKEGITKFDKKDFENILCNNLDNIDFEKIQQQYELSKVEEAEIVEDEETDEVTDEVTDQENIHNIENETYVRLNDEESKAVMSEDPSRFIFEVIGDLLKVYPNTPKMVISGIDNILNEPDFAQHVYQYLRSHVTKLTPDSYFGPANINEIVKLLGEMFEKEKSDYNAIVTEICQPIPEEYLTKIVNYVNSCISDLILDKEEQKQYLISQLIENQIETYQQLQQIIGLIEDCSVIGKNTISYVILNDYLEDNTDISTLFTKTENLESIKFRLSFVGAFYDWHKAMVQSDTKESEKLSE